MPVSSKSKSKTKRKSSRSFVSPKSRSPEFCRYECDTTADPASFHGGLGPGHRCRVG